MARKPDEWMPLNIGDYMRDTTNLTRDLHGAYLLLLMAYWMRGAPLPADDTQLAAMAKASPTEWRKMKPIIAAFFQERDGQWHQKRADEELAKANGLVAAKAAAGQRGGAAKWGDSSNEVPLTAAATRSQRLAAARALAIHTPEEWAALVDIFEDRCVRCGAEGKVVKDHIKPIYKGGSDGLENLQPLCSRCNSAKGPEEIDHRDNACQDWRKRLAECLATACQTPTEMPAPLPQPKPIPGKNGNKTSFSNEFSGRAGKSGKDSVTIEDPDERIARFQKKIAEAIGAGGWRIVAAAADPSSPEHDQALDLCKSAAAKLGKGWPHHWPMVRA